MKKLFYPFLFTLLLFTVNVKAQNFNFAITPSVQCYSAGSNSAYAVVTAPAPSATNYTWTATNPVGGSSTIYPVPFPPNATVAINFGACGIYTIYCFAYNNTITPGTPVLITSVSHTAMVVCASIPSITALPGNTLCSGLSATLTASGAPNYSWSTNATTNSIVVTPMVNTTYTVSSMTGSCGPYSSMVTLTVSPSPTVAATSPNATICAGESTTITATGASLYLWSTLSIGSGILVSPLVTTSYTVVGTTADGCISGATFTQNVVICTGVEQLQDYKQLFIVYPNPGNGLFNVQLNQVKENFLLEVYNAIGQLILSQKLNSEFNEINLKNYPRGLYYLKASHGEEYEFQKIIRE